MAKHKIERLPQEDKHVHELPPEALPQKGERKPEAPTQRKLSGKGIAMNGRAQIEVPSTGEDKGEPQRNVETPL